jgi:proteic killer suppression protein
MIRGANGLPAGQPDTSGLADRSTYNAIRYTLSVIQSFRDPTTEDLFVKRKSRRWAGIAKVAIRKLDMLDAAKNLNDLRVPPANRLERLVHDRVGQHSIRINEQYRICFVWKEDGAHEVEIVDYH